MFFCVTILLAAWSSNEPLTPLTGILPHLLFITVAFPLGQIAEPAVEVIQSWGHQQHMPQDMNILWISCYECHLWVLWVCTFVPHMCNGLFSPKASGLEILGLFPASSFLHTARLHAGRLFCNIQLVHFIQSCFLAKHVLFPTLNKPIKLIPDAWRL